MNLKIIRTLAAAVALSAAMVSPIGAQQTQHDVCFLTDAQAREALSAPVQHAALSDGTCAYRTTVDPNLLSFVTVIGHPINGSTPATIFTSWLQQAKTYAHPISGISNAYTIGTSVMALRNGRVVLAGVSGAGESQERLRTASEQLALRTLQNLK